MWAMGDKERAMGVPISPMCDKEKDTNMAQSQIGFINYICLPLYSALSDLLDPGMKPYLQLKENLSMWEARRAEATSAEAAASSTKNNTPDTTDTTPTKVEKDRGQKDPDADVTTSEPGDMAA
eukprot:2764084-Prymnesium_polylepis.1